MWQAYLNKRGTLHDGLRLEYLFARLSAHISQCTGNSDAQAQDYLRYHDPVDGESNEVDISELAKLMRAQVKPNG